VFALSGYPYSLKLLWSPIVDSKFIPSVGRRKSWIVPMQLIIAVLMFYISLNVDALLVKARAMSSIAASYADRQTTAGG
jgi:MFS transporter, PAT family, solute carrier family 33 (acetyl-CoA transportor), member 1